MNRLSIIAPLAFAFAFSALSAPAARAQWSAPTSTPPLGNVASPLNVSGTGQTKIGGLTLNTGGATYGLLVPNGKVGVGTLSPASLLSVAGGLQVGDDTGTCDSSKAGTIRWHSGAMQICSSNAWSAFNPPTGAYGTCSTASSGTTDGGCVNYNPAYASSDKVQCAAQSPATCAAYNSTATNLCTCPSDWSLQLVRTNSVYVSARGTQRPITIRAISRPRRSRGLALSATSEAGRA